MRKTVSEKTGQWSFQKPDLQPVVTQNGAVVRQINQTTCAEAAALHPFRAVVTIRLCPMGRRTNTGMGFPDIREKSLVVSIIYIRRFFGGSSRGILCRAEKGTAGSFTDFQYPLFRVGRSVCRRLAAEFCVSDVGLCPSGGKRRRQDEASPADRSVPFFSTDSSGSV